MSGKNMDKLAKLEEILLTRLDQHIAELNQLLRSKLQDARASQTECNVSQCATQQNFELVYYDKAKSDQIEQVKPEQTDPNKQNQIDQDQQISLSADSIIADDRNQQNAKTRIPKTKNQQSITISADTVTASQDQLGFVFKGFGFRIIEHDQLELESRFRELIQTHPEFLSFASNYLQQLIEQYRSSLARLIKLLVDRLREYARRANDSADNRAYNQHYKWLTTITEYIFSRLSDQLFSTYLDDWLAYHLYYIAPILYLAESKQIRQSVRFQKLLWKSFILPRLFVPFEQHIEQLQSIIDNRQTVTAVYDNKLIHTLLQQAEFRFVDIDIYAIPYYTAITNNISESDRSDANIELFVEGSEARKAEAEHTTAQNYIERYYRIYLAKLTNISTNRSIYLNMNSYPYRFYVKYPFELLGLPYDANRYDVIRLSDPDRADQYLINSILKRLRYLPHDLQQYLNQQSLSESERQQLESQLAEQWLLFEPFEPVENLLELSVQLKNVVNLNYKISEQYPFAFYEFDIPLIKPILDIQSELGEQYLTDEPNIAYFDIEVDHQYRVNIEIPIAPVNAITIVFSKAKKAYTLYLRTNEQQAELDEKRYKEKLAELAEQGYTAINEYDIELEVFDSEIELLFRFLELLSIYNPDILTAWNIQFDIKYIFNRLKHLGLFPYIGYAPTGYPVYFSRRENLYRIPHTVVIDMIDAYQYIVKLGKQLDFRGLGYNAKEILGLTKIEYTGDLHQLYLSDPTHFIIYNTIDALLLSQIEQATQMFSIAFSMCRLASIPLSQYDRTTAFGDGMFAIYARKNGLRIRNKTPHYDKLLEKYPGGFVREAQTGTVYKQIIDFDASSMYPSIIITYNLSPDSVIFYIEDAIFTSKLVDYAMKKLAKLAPNYNQLHILSKQTDYELLPSPFYNSHLGTEQIDPSAAAVATFFNYFDRYPATPSIIIRYKPQTVFYGVKLIGLNYDKGVYRIEPNREYGTYYRDYLGLKNAPQPKKPAQRYWRKGYLIRLTWGQWTQLLRAFQQSNDPSVPKLIIAPTGAICYDHSYKLGIHTQIQYTLRKDRKYWQKLEAEATVSTERRKYKTQQQVRKRGGNSLYGATGEDEFRYYDPCLSGNTTGAGRFEVGLVSWNVEHILYQLEQLL